MYPILFSLGPINFYSYGLFAAIAVIAGYLVAKKLATAKKLSTKDLLDKIIVVFLWGLLGARLLYFIIYFNQFNSWWEFFYIWNGGLVSFGGIIASLIAIKIIFKSKLTDWLDVIAVSFLLGSAIWRIGGYLSGGNPGVVLDSALSISGRLPIVLIESLVTFIIFIIFYQIYLNYKLKSGLMFWIILATYGLVRFLIDYGRDYQAIYLNLRSGQIIGLLIFIGAVIAIFNMMLYDKTKKQTK